MWRAKTYDKCTPNFSPLTKNALLPNEKTFITPKSVIEIFPSPTSQLLVRCAWFQRVPVSSYRSGTYHVQTNQSKTVSACKKIIAVHLYGSMRFTWYSQVTLRTYNLMDYLKVRVTCIYFNPSHLKPWNSRISSYFIPSTVDLMWKLRAPRIRHACIADRPIGMAPSNCLHSRCCLKKEEKF